MRGPRLPSGLPGLFTRPLTGSRSKGDAPMAREKILGIDLEELGQKDPLLAQGIRQDRASKPMSSDAIARDHEGKKHQLTPVANYLSNMLQLVPEVHSVKSRLKNPVSLVAKMIRKRMEAPERIISFENYEKEITDLIGVRALHLFKGQWKPVWIFRENPRNGARTASGLPSSRRRRGDLASVP